MNPLGSGGPLRDHRADGLQVAPPRRCGGWEPHPHRPRTTPTPAREAVAVAPRRTPPPPLDGLPAAVREFLNPKVSRPGPGRRLRRHGVGSPRGMKAQVRRLQGPWARLHPYRREIPAADERRDRPAPSLRGGRPRRPVGVCPHLPGEIRRRRQALPAGSRACVSSRNPDRSHGQRQGVHGSSVRPARTCGYREARVRATLRRARHRASTDTATVAPDRRYGRAFQRPRRRCPAGPPLPVRRRSRADAPALRPAPQPTAAAIRPRKRNAVAGHQTSAQTQTGAVQEKSIPARGI